MVNLFQLGKFRLHSGDDSEWKIDCDALTGGDITALAGMGASLLAGSPFREVVGVPSGGLRLAEAMRRYADPSARAVLVVDDVLTTGRSMREAREFEIADRVGEREVLGLVIFARTDAEPWVRRLFQASSPLLEAAPALLAAQTMGASHSTPDFLDWVADRLVHFYGESPNVDFVLSLRERAAAGRAALERAVPVRKVG